LEAIRSSQTSSRRWPATALPKPLKTTSTPRSTGPRQKRASEPRQPSRPLISIGISCSPSARREPPTIGRRRWSPARAAVEPRAAQGDASSGLQLFLSNTAILAYYDFDVRDIEVESSSIDSRVDSLGGFVGKIDLRGLVPILVMISGFSAAEAQPQAKEPQYIPFLVTIGKNYESPGAIPAEFDEVASVPMPGIEHFNAANCTSGAALSATVNSHGAHTQRYQVSTGECSYKDGKLLIPYHVLVDGDLPALISGIVITGFYRTR